MDRPDRQATLLKEYEICEAIIEQNETAIWTTATIFFSASLGAIAFVASRDTHDLSSLLLILAVAVGATGILAGWYRAFMRWRQFQHMAYHRMREIEEELGSYIVRYGYYLDNLKRLQPLYEDESRADAKQFRQVRSALAPHWTTFTRSRAFLIIVGTLAALWAALLIREAIVFLIMQPNPVKP